jgi:hypothetical protein
MPKPVCKRCRHYRAGHFGPSGTPGKESVCALPLPTRDGVVTCAAARAVDGDCTPDGLFFDEREAA